MKFNALIPEIAVTDLVKSRHFYTQVLPFTVWYDRKESGLVVIVYEGSQLILFQMNDRWKTGEMEYPFGRGINFEISSSAVGPIITSLSSHGYPLFRPVTEEWYRVDDMVRGIKQFLVQDPDGYLLRFAEHLGTKPLPKEGGLGNT